MSLPSEQQRISSAPLIQWWVVVAVVLVLVWSVWRFSSSTSASPAVIQVGASAPKLAWLRELLTDVSVKAVLLSLINTQADPSSGTSDASRAQLVSLKSAATQYTSKGLRVVLIDSSQIETGRSSSLAAAQNFALDWQLESVIFRVDPFEQSAARAFGVVELPTVFLIDKSGVVLERWSGRVPPSTLALAVQKTLRD